MLADRINRLESLDMCNLDAHINLFAPDIRVSRDKAGRPHIKRWLDVFLTAMRRGAPDPRIRVR